MAATTVVVLRRYPAQYLTGDFAATGEEGAGRQRLLTEAEEEVGGHCQVRYIRSDAFHCARGLA